MALHCYAPVNLFMHGSMPHAVHKAAYKGSILRAAGVTAGLAESNGSLPPGL